MSKKKQYTTPVLFHEDMVTTAFFCGSNDNMKISKAENSGDDGEHDSGEIYEVSVPWPDVKDDDDVTAD